MEFNNPTFVTHIANIAAAEKDKSFDYGGRTTQPEGKFLNGECGMIQTSSGAYGIFKSGAKFALRLAAMLDVGPTAAACRSEEDADLAFDKGGQIRSD